MELPLRFRVQSSGNTCSVVLRSRETWILLLACGIVLPCVSLATSHKCDYLTVRGLQTADCSDRGLKDVPNNLQSDIQVLDLSRNRIRVLHNDSFERYRSLKILYLSENSILKIENGAFQSVTSLEVLDLSTNAVKKFSAILPSTVYRLYLTENPEVNISTVSLSTVSVLYLANCDLEEIPKLGFLPNLMELNVSNNALKRLTPDDLAPFCQLKYLHVSSPALFTDRSNETLCNCLKLEKWATLRQIQVYSFTCKYEKKVTLICDTEPSHATVDLYNACMSEWQFRKIPTIVLTAAGILAILICLFIIIYIKCRRNRDTGPKSPRDSASRDSSVKFVNDHNAPIMGEK